MAARFKCKKCGHEFDTRYGDAQVEVPCPKDNCTGKATRVK